jgi:hypothetical protein
MQAPFPTRITRRRIDASRLAVVPLHPAAEELRNVLMIAPSCFVDSFMIYTFVLTGGGPERYHLCRGT